MGEVVEALLPGSPLLSKVGQDGLDVMFTSVARAKTKELGHQPLKSHQRVLVVGLLGRRMNLMIIIVEGNKC